MGRGNEGIVMDYKAYNSSSFFHVISLIMYMVHKKKKTIKVEVDLLGWEMKHRTFG